MAGPASSSVLTLHRSVVLVLCGAALGAIASWAVQPASWGSPLAPELAASMEAMAHETLTRNIEKMEAELHLLHSKLEASQEADRALSVRVRDMRDGPAHSTATAELARVRALVQKLTGGEATAATMEEMDALTKSTTRLAGDVQQVRTALEQSNSEHIERYRELRALFNGQSDENSDSVASLLRRKVAELQQGIDANEAELGRLAVEVGKAKPLLDHPDTLATMSDLKAASWDLSDSALVDAMVQQEPTVKKWMQEVLAAEANCVTQADVMEMVRNRLRLKTADDVGLRDFALDQNNGTIVHDKTTPAYNPQSDGLVNSISSFLGKVLHDNSSFPELAISQGVAKGECFAFEGGVGNLTVRLGKPIHAGAVTIEHLNKIYGTLGGTSAPRAFTVWGFRDAPSLHRGQGTRLLDGEYILDDLDIIQTFREVNPAATQPVSFVTLEVKSNWGSEYTCLYRFRVHSETQSA